MDDIIFRSKDSKLCEEFVNLMSKEFEISATRKLNFFLGLQIKQLSE